MGCVRVIPRVLGDRACVVESARAKKTKCAEGKETHAAGAGVSGGAAPPFSRNTCTAWSRAVHPAGWSALALSETTARVSLARKCTPSTLQSPEGRGIT